MIRKYLLILLSIGIISCNNNKISGEGSNITIDRTAIAPSGIKTVKVYGSSGLEIIQSNNLKLEISGYENLVAILKTEMVNNTLTVSFPDNYSINNNNTVIKLAMPTLPNVYLNGISDASITGIFPAQTALVMDVNGSGNILAQNANMSIDFGTYNITGSGSIKAFNILSKDFNTTITGSGEMELSAFHKINATINGSGKVLYKGNPTVNSNITGTGQVSRVN